MQQRATVDQSAIPWLLLQAKSPTPGKDGDRQAGNSTFTLNTATGRGGAITDAGIGDLNLVNNTINANTGNTGGGLAPTDRCNRSTSGTMKEVPYTADYFFWKKTGGA